MNFRSCSSLIMAALFALPAFFAQAQTLIPGGVNSPARAFGSVGGTPVVIDRAEGPWLFDVDGNRYLDYVLSWGPMILGHANRRVSDALCRAVRRGTSYGAPTVMENKIAEQVGNQRVFNTVVLGVAARHMDVEKEVWLKVIERTVPPKTVEINKKAFLTGLGE